MHGLSWARDLAVRFAAVADAGDFDGVAEVAEDDAVILGAETVERRVDALKPLDVAGAGFGEALDGPFGALSWRDRVSLPMRSPNDSIRYNGPAMLAAQTLAPAVPVSTLIDLPAVPVIASTTAFLLTANLHQGSRSTVATWQLEQLPGNNESASVAALRSP